MGKYKIAGLVVEMNPAYKTLTNQAKAYEIKTNDAPQIILKVDDKLLLQMKTKYNHLSLDDLEYICMGQLFSREILQYQGFFLHSSAVVKDNEAYLFSAPSGTGKSTHTGLWLDTFKDAFILNDDKPIILLREKILAAGTPFSGKVDLSRNIQVPIKGICFLERSSNNEITRLSKQEAIFNLLDQTFRIPFKEDMNIILDVVTKLVSQVPIYKLKCNVSKEAVYLAYNTMK